MADGGTILPRRDRRHLAQDAGRAPPRATGARVRAHVGGTDAGPRRRPPHLRDAPRPGSDGRGRPVSRGPLLSPQGNPDRATAARARAPARHPLDRRRRSCLASVKSARPSPKALRHVGRRGACSATAWPGNIREARERPPLGHACSPTARRSTPGRSPTTSIPTRAGPSSPRRRPRAPKRAPAPPGDASDLGDVYDRALASKIPLRELKRRIELECITRALADENGNITCAAERLGMKRPRAQSQLLKEHKVGIGTDPRIRTKRERS